MLLTPEHFRRSDAYSVELFEWLLRYSASTSGLLGGGPRLARSERGLERHDPRLEVWDDGSVVRISVIQARGVTPDGGFVEIGAPRVLRREFSRSELTGQNEHVVYVIRSGVDEEDDSSVGADDANPVQRAWVHEGYGIRLGVRADELGDALAVGRIRRVAETQTFESDAQFIPACASMLAHSSLFAGWQRLQTELRLIAGSFGELHREIAVHSEQKAKKGMLTVDDQSVAEFVERALLALDGCVYETMDPSRAPAAVFQQVDRAARQIALALDLSAATRDYLALLSHAEASYNSLLEEERNSLGSDRELSLRSDLRLELDRAEQALVRVRALLHGLEGRYLDFRVNPSVEALRFLIDRGGEQFYTQVTAAGNAQRDAGDVLTFAFTQLNLPAKHDYRLVILGDPNGVSKWEVGDELRTTMRLNAASGGGRPSDRTLHCEVPGQRNFALDFSTPTDLAMISSIHVQVYQALKVRGALLFQRRRGLVPESVGSGLSEGHGGRPASTPVVPESNTERARPSGQKPVIKFNPK
jgi:hypothetical protein